MKKAERTRRGRTFALCLLALAGLLILDWYAIYKSAESSLLLAAGVVVSIPLAAWIGGKAWASAMGVLATFGKEE